MPVWEVCRNEERRRNKSEGSSLPILSSPRLVCVRRDGGLRAAVTLHKYSLLVLYLPLLRVFSLCWVNTTSAEIQPGEMCSLFLAHTSASQDGCGFHRCLPAPLSQHLEQPQTSPHSQSLSPPLPSSPSGLTWFCSDLFRGVLKDNVIAVSADSPRNS